MWFTKFVFHIILFIFYDKLIEQNKIRPKILITEQSISNFAEKFFSKFGDETYRWTDI